MVSTRSAALLRVVSYNVLSSHLAAPSHFITYDPKHLDASARLPKVLSKLQAEMDDESRGSSGSSSTIFCLQEVSYDWAGELHTFFASHGYHVVTGLYGKPFNGYMGVLTAYPISKLETVAVDISRLSDTYENWPEQPEPPGVISTVLSKLASAPRKLLGMLGQQQDAEECHWRMARRRFNVLLTVSLRDKQSGQKFCVGNYHMPCAYYAPYVMTMHGDMCLAHVQRLASAGAASAAAAAAGGSSGNGNNDTIDRCCPYVLAGDFNFKSCDPVYRLLTTGELDPEDCPLPPSHQTSHEWKPTIQEAVRSVYEEVSGGREPDFTNFARVGEDEPFIDTLDYIFVSPTGTGVQIDSVKKLPHRDGAGGPFPNENEPSDHLLIAADLSISSVVAGSK